MELADDAPERHDDPLNSILIGGREQREITIVAYDPAWPARFTRERSRIAILGRVARRIEHIGSTAVPGIAAKPIIDILVTVDDVGDEARYVPALAACGYVLRVRETDHRMFRTAARDVHVHVWRSGSDEERRHILFRDWLRGNAPDRELYEQTKRELARRSWTDTNEYADAKTAVIAAILERAIPTGQRWPARPAGATGATRGRDGKGVFEAFSIRGGNRVESNARAIIVPTIEEFARFIEPRETLPSRRSFLLLPALAQK